nr:protein kinase [Oceanococcus sp. HetDA_MAG_MS8]
MERKIRKCNGRRAGELVGSWQLDYLLGRGGNGDVWRAKKAGEAAANYAVKFLHKTDSESRARFRVEIDTLKKIGPTAGVVPIVDCNNPPNEAAEVPWFVMPLAQSFEEYKLHKSKVDLAKDFVSLAQTLHELHQQGYSHRDIKPANILFYDNQLCFSDFGLVKFPEREDLTPQKRDVGAKFTMAPEMRRRAADADGIRADVYSFAKTLWIAITGEDLGFDGQYNPDSVLALRSHLEGLYTTPLDRLLTECTDTDPNRRPSMASVRDRIKEWVALTEDFFKRNQLEWVELTNKLFPFGAPARASWSGIDEICTVLSAIADAPSLNHMFYPSKGGMTLLGANRSHEPGKIELLVGVKKVEILEPRKLSYESFGADLNWSYFRLEAKEIDPSGVEDAVYADGISEELTEISPGKYVPYRHWDYGELNGQPLPDSARPVTRFLEGSFVFFSTSSAYNQAPETYDARHNNMSEDVFRAYVERSANASLAGEAR